LRSAVGRTCHSWRSLKLSPRHDRARSVPKRNSYFGWWFLRLERARHRRLEHPDLCYVAERLDALWKDPSTFASIATIAPLGFQAAQTQTRGGSNLYAASCTPTFQNYGDRWGLFAYRQHTQFALLHSNGAAHAAFVYTQDGRPTSHQPAYHRGNTLRRDLVFVGRLCSRSLCDISAAPGPPASESTLDTSNCNSIPPPQTIYRPHLPRLFLGTYDPTTMKLRDVAKFSHGLSAHLTLGDSGMAKHTISVRTGPIEIWRQVPERAQVDTPLMSTYTVQRRLSEPIPNVSFKQHYYDNSYKLDTTRTNQVCGIVNANLRISQSEHFWRGPRRTYGLWKGFCGYLMNTLDSASAFASFGRAF